MGSVGLGSNAQLGAFQNKIFPEGLDLGRCQIREALGVFVADPLTTFRAGMLVMQDTTTGLVKPSDGSTALGVAKWNHTQTMLSIAVDEAQVLTGTTANNLAHGNVSNVRVASGLAGAGTVYVAGTDYTVSATNGTLVRINGGGITSGATVYATYSYQLTASQLIQTQGQNFWNNLDEVSFNEGRCAIITAAELLFTTQYDATQNYAIGAKLYAATGSGLGGLFTTSSTGSAYFVGTVFQAPSATDPYLGLRLIKGPHV